MEKKTNVYDAIIEALREAILLLDWHCVTMDSKLLAI